ncbi:MAG: high frequency lysogenization protein HflD [Alphaproteobacteria bacterium]|nr:high frequency lysogenization protein HflD [Alphaproteobacteria bacterium]
MEGFLALGFLIGMQHALEADHLAAVGAMAADRHASRRGLVLRGAAWGLGHTITLFAICSAVILLGLTLTDRIAAALEFGVGVMLVLLGLDVLRRMRAKRIHFHAHIHDGGRPHIHAHSHQGATTPHAADPHHHRHPHGFPLRALAIGLIHGAAGSAGLLALAVAATKEPLAAVGYVAVFGLGSILGMAALSFVAAWPLGAAERRAKWLHGGLSVGAAMVAIGLGVDVMLQTAGIAWGGL